MYWLIIFYFSTRDALVPFDPIPKFLCVKGLLFFSFWQSVVITVLVQFGVITEIPVIHYSVEHVSSTIQNSLICLEMLVFAILHTRSFSVEPFRFLRTLTPAPPRSARTMFRNAIDLSDVVEDLRDSVPRFSRSAAPVVPNLMEKKNDESLRVMIPTAEGIRQISEISKNSSK